MARPKTLRSENSVLPKRPAKVASPNAVKRTPIVGIGASAGGLEALEQLLAHVPVDSQMAFVIVQHLDPTQPGLLVELLQRSTPMAVSEIQDHTLIRPNCVYVIPPNKDLSILHGVLHLLDPMAQHGLRLPIDFFFRALATDQTDQGIAIILSGMGSDGTLGIKAIKEHGGVVLVQDPDAAKSKAMPRSAIETGLVDIVAPAGDLPAKLIAYLKHPLLPIHSENPLSEQTQNALDKIIILLRTHSGHDFSLYKKSTIHRRVTRRMGLHQVEKFSDYIRYLQENPQELGLLFKELLIGVTNFFRDTAAWDQLRDEALPALLKRQPERNALRAWVAGCSTGEEAYSLAMVFKEALATISEKRICQLQIFATDLDREAISFARQGLYPENIESDVSPERIGRFFTKDKAGWRINKEIREMVVFSQQDLCIDPPFTKLDILSCRNVFIYFELGLQKKLIPLFHFCLNPGGMLFMGSAETVGSFHQLFKALEGKARIFHREASTRGAKSTYFPLSLMSTKLLGPDDTMIPKPGASFQSTVEQLLLLNHTPAAILANENGEILYINGRTGRYLEPAVGKANWNIFAMARDSLRYELMSAFQQVLHKKGPLLISNVRLGPPTRTDSVNMSLQQLQEPENLRGLVLITFQESRVAAEPPIDEEPTGAKRASGAKLVLEQKLTQARTELQATREQMQMSQEELRSAIEELQSTNEELQSTNEELTTSKEEMQSLNEELQTLNGELQGKVDELSRSNNDMQNLLNSTDIATVFLDNSLNVRRFTTQATRIFKLIQGDVGRPLSDLSNTLVFPAMLTDASEVLRTLVPTEKQIQTLNGGAFVVRIMPYRTLDNRIDGLVMTFSDTARQHTMITSPPTVP